MEESDLQFENFQSSKSILDKYNRATGEWKFPKTGEFWDAVQAAHNNGFTGDGQTIAVIDSGFDLRIPKLNAQSNGKVEQKSGLWKSVAHGTVVALLILEVAPKAKLKLYEVSSGKKPDLNKVLKALNLAANSESGIINLSIGKPIKQKETHSRSWDDHCELCRYSSFAAKKGKKVIASVGNQYGELFCPASNPRVIGIGFQSEIRTDYFTQDGGVAENVVWEKPSFTQAINPDYTLIQPEDVLGSSFASPLICGALALTGNSPDIVPLFESLKTCGIAEVLHARLHKNQNPSLSDVEATKHEYLKALNQMPHLHFDDPAGTPCIECSLFAQGLYVNAGLFFLESGDFQLSEKLLRAARWLAPWSPHALANLATLLREKAIKLFNELKDIKSCLTLLQESREEYLNAIKINPNCESYYTGLNKVNEWLFDLTKN